MTTISRNISAGDIKGGIFKHVMTDINLFMIDIGSVFDMYIYFYVDF